MAGMAAISFAAAYFVFPTDILTTSDRRVDWVGAALVTVGLVLLQFVVSAGETAPQGWKTPCTLRKRSVWGPKLTADIIVLLVVGVILVGAFFLWEHHVINKTTRPPLMRLALWTRAKGRLAAVYMIGFVSWMGFTVSLSRVHHELACPPRRHAHIFACPAAHAAVGHLSRHTLLSTGPNA